MSSLLKQPMKEEKEEEEEQQQPPIKQEEEEHHVQLLSFWFSPFGARAVMALRAKGVAFQYLEQDLLSKSQLLLDSNPVHKKVPLLIHHGKCVAESLIIVEYVDEVWPSPEGKDLLPKGAYDRALARFWADYVDKKILAAGSRVLSTVGGDQEKAIEEMIDALVPLDKALNEISQGKPFFNGDHMGYLDIALASCTPGMLTMEVLFNANIFDDERLPHLSKWVEKVHEEPCVKETFTADPVEVVEFTKALRERLLAT